jgi:hypothetical protein
MLTGWDATALKNWELQDGTSIEAVYGMLNGALGSLNAELVGGLWGSLISLTDKPDLEYRVGVSNGFEVHTEYGRPDEARAATEGHMLPYQKFDRALGWTWDYLEDARMEQLEADIADVIKDARDIWRQKILGRLLQRGDDSGANKGLGTGGLSPGFATTAASTGVDFVPPSYGGTAFSSTHEHYVGITGGAWTVAAFADMVAELREHGHEPPYEFITGPSDEDAIRALTGFVPVQQVNVQYGTSENRATLPLLADANGSYYIGVIKDVNVRIVRGMPQYYGFAWRTYGGLSQRNPLRVRLDKLETRPMFMAANDPRNGSPAHPLQYMMIKGGFGVGVADRTNGTPRYNNNATWADGTAS